MFYVSATIASLLYFRLAMQWRALCLCFRRVEHAMKDLGYPPHLRRRLHGITVTVLSLALGEQGAGERCWGQRKGFQMFVILRVDCWQSSTPWRCRPGSSR